MKCIILCVKLPVILMKTPVRFHSRYTPFRTETFCKYLTFKYSIYNKSRIYREITGEFAGWINYG